MAGIKSWVERLTQADADALASYAHPELRRPVGLPMREVYLGVELTADDLGTGAVWPPERGYPRVMRMEHQREAALGDLSHWLHTDQDVMLNPIGDHEDMVCAMLLASPPRLGGPSPGVSIPPSPGGDQPPPDPMADPVAPESGDDALDQTGGGGQDGDPSVDARLGSVVECAAVDMLRHGRTVLIGTGPDDVRHVDIRWCWPVAEDPMDEDSPQMWIFAIPRITGVATEATRYDAVDIMVWDDGTLTGQTYAYHSAGLRSRGGRLGPVIGPLPSAEGVKLAVADRGPMTNEWGTPITDRLIPIAVELCRRESGMSYAIDRNERPIWQARMATADLAEIDITSDLEGAALQGRKQLMEQAPLLRQHDVLIIPDGMDPGEYVTWDQNMEASESFLARMDQMWTRATGFAPIEAADSGSVPSGVAIARRNAMAVARNRQLHASLSAALTEIVGPLEWPYIDAETAEAPPALGPMMESGPPPPPGAEEEEEDAPPTDDIDD